jgi:hypothetical protein
MRRNDGRGFESHATAEKYNGHLISARTPSTASVVKFHTTTQMEDLGMLLQTEYPYSKHPKKKKKKKSCWNSSSRWELKFKVNGGDVKEMPFRILSQNLSL